MESSAGVNRNSTDDKRGQENENYVKQIFKDKPHGDGVRKTFKQTGRLIIKLESSPDPNTETQTVFCEAMRERSG